MPLVVYETISDYYSEVAEGRKVSETEYSPKLQKLLAHLIEEKKWTDDQIDEMTSGIKIRYADGSVSKNLIDLQSESDLFDAVKNLYTLIGADDISKYVSFTDWNGAETFINTDEVSIIEMPLIGVEKKIEDSFEELLEELGKSE